MKKAILYADSNRGVYIPHLFAQSIDRSKWRFIDPDDLAILEMGPDDNPEYWEAWNRVLIYAETYDGGVLHHDGDLWVIYAQDAIAAVNEWIAAQIEYAEKHADSGDGYAHLPREGDSHDQARRLADYVSGDCGVALESDALDSLHDECLERFEMRPGHIWTASAMDSPDDFILAAYPVTEHEFQLDPESIGIDGITWEFIRESSDIDAYVRGEWLYTSTDAVWYAVVPGDVMNELVGDAMDSQDLQRIGEILNPWSYSDSIKSAVISEALADNSDYDAVTFNYHGDELLLINFSRPENNARYVARLEGDGIGNEQWGVDAVNAALAGKLSRPFGGWASC